MFVKVLNMFIVYCVCLWFASIYHRKFLVGVNLLGNKNFSDSDHTHQSSGKGNALLLTLSTRTIVFLNTGKQTGSELAYRFSYRDPFFFLLLPSIVIGATH